MVPKMLIVVMLVGSACAATWFGYPKKPKEFANKEGCYIEEINDVVPYGTTLTPQGQCYRIHCDRGTVDYASCPLVGTEDSKCYVTPEDTTKLYPQCCPNVECDLDNSVI